KPMAAIAHGIDHRVLEMRAPPPGDEPVRLAAFCSSNGATASVNPFCMSTTVPCWSNANALIDAWGFGKAHLLALWLVIAQDAMRSDVRCGRPPIRLPWQLKGTYDCGTACRV